MGTLAQITQEFMSKTYHQTGGAFKEILEDAEGNIDLKKIMQPELANIVLVKQEEMEKWFSKQNQLKSELDGTKRKVDAKLDEYREGYNEQYNQIADQKDRDIKDLN
jgi:hypothetical protein